METDNLIMKGKGGVGVGGWLRDGTLIHVCGPSPLLSINEDVNQFHAAYLLSLSYLLLPAFPLVQVGRITISKSKQLRKVLVTNWHTPH